MSNSNTHHSSTFHFRTLLSGGHHNSLGRTVEVTEIVLADKEKMDELYQCYFSEDEVVRLRTSSAFKRITLEKPEWTADYLDKFLNEISKIDQASTQWTLAILFKELRLFMSVTQFANAQKIVKNNLENHNDWIVLNYSMEALAEWAKTDESLKKWLRPHLERLQNDPRKAVAKRASKVRAQLKET